MSTFCPERELNELTHPNEELKCWVMAVTVSTAGLGARMGRGGLVGKCPEIWLLLENIPGMGVRYSALPAELHWALLGQKSWNHRQELNIFAVCC